MVRALLRALQDRLLNKKSIQFQLMITYMFVILIPIVIIGYITYRVSSGTIAEEVRRNNRQLIEEIERNIGIYFRNISIDANTFTAKLVNNNIKLNNKQVFSDIFILENIMEINDYIYSAFDSTKDYLSIRVYSDRGDLISSALDRETFKVYAYNTVEERIWRDRMQLNESDKLIFDVHRLDRDGPIGVVVSRPAINPFNGSRIGYISYDKNLESFAGLFQPFEQRPGSAIQLIREDGTILYHTDRSRIGKLVDPAWLAELNSRFITASGPEANADDNTSMIIARRLHELQSYIVGSVPLSVINEPKRTIGNVTVLISVISLLLVLVLSLWLSLYISRPLRRLSKAMQQAQVGLRTDPNPVEERSSLETSQLSRSFSSMLSRFDQLVKTQYETELHKKDAELKALMMQINPHFLYNTLEVISGIADYEGVEQISDITQSLSKMLRYNIDLKQEEVRLADEIENCRHFFLILKSRFEDKLRIEQDIDEQALKYKIIKITLQPIIENAVKHGVEKKLGQAVIRLEVHKEADTVLIRIIDNGTGFSLEELQAFDHFKQKSENTFYEPTEARKVGLKNVYRRLHIVFGSRLSFRVDSKPGEGTTVTICIPAIEI